MHEYENFDDEPPLLEELGIDFGEIRRRTYTVLRPLKPLEPEDAIGEPDLAGPLVFCLALGGLLLLRGKLHFGAIYGFGVCSCASMYLLLGLLAEARAAPPRRSASRSLVSERRRAPPSLTPPPARARRADARGLSRARHLGARLRPAARDRARGRSDCSCRSEARTRPRAAGGAVAWSTFSATRLFELTLGMAAQRYTRCVSHRPRVRVLRPHHHLLDGLPRHRALDDVRGLSLVVRGDTRGRHATLQADPRGRPSALPPVLRYQHPQTHRACATATR